METLQRCQCRSSSSAGGAEDKKLKSGWRACSSVGLEPVLEDSKDVVLVKELVDIAGVGFLASGVKTSYPKMLRPHTHGGCQRQSSSCECLASYLLAVVGCSSRALFATEQAVACRGAGRGLAAVESEKAGKVSASIGGAQWVVQHLCSGNSYIRVRIWTGEPGRLLSEGCKRYCMRLSVRHLNPKHVMLHARECTYQRGQTTFMVKTMRLQFYGHTFRSNL